MSDSNDQSSDNVLRTPQSSDNVLRPSQSPDSVLGATPLDEDGAGEGAGFEQFGLDRRLVTAVAALGFTDPTPIQCAAIPPLREGRDVIGRARTGSGKTAAFALPVLDRVREGGKGVRALVLTPTRELALQVTRAFVDYANGLPVKVVSVYGGSAYEPQLKALRQGATVVVGTPGRVLDHMARGTLDLSKLEVLVLDEADEMLRMGFIDDVEQVLAATPTTRQVALFSATMPDPIRRIASKHQRDPVEIAVEGQRMASDHIEQRWMLVPGRHKVEAVQRVLQVIESDAVLVFVRTRIACAETADALASLGVAADALHGDLSQTARELVLSRFKSGRVQVLVATDVAARGIDVDRITHVVNMDMPPDIESYVHRIGRTGRAGREGLAISFVMPAERHKVRSLERVLKVQIEQMPVPRDADIARVRQERLLATLVSGHADHPLDAKRWLAEAVEATGLSIEDLAASAVAWLARERRVDLAPTEEEVPADGDEAHLFVAIGRRHGIRPADLVGALATEHGVAGRDVGRVTILERKSFVGLPIAVAERLLAAEPRLVIRGIEVRLARARGVIPRS
ncbi:MAG: DEAD/DEAH box helicase [Myxococcota bacterium]